MSVIKVSVEDFDSGNKVLVDLDSTKSLEDNIEHIKKRLCKPAEAKQGLYGLKLLATNNGTFRNIYLTEDNFHEIKDGYFLKLVLSLNYLITRIFEHLGDCLRERSFEDLSNLSTDPEFIKELAKSGEHVTLIEYVTKHVDLQDNELTPCLIVIVHLFLKGLLQEVSHEFLNRIFTILDDGTSSAEVLKYSLSIFHKILCQKDSKFYELKQKIIAHMSLKKLFHFIEDYSNRDLHTGALLLINTVIRCCKDPQRTELMKEISSKHCRDKISRFIIEKGDTDKSTSHELYVYQTYMLHSLCESLHHQIYITDVLRGEFELQGTDFNRKSDIIEFSEEATKGKIQSTEDMLTIGENTRFSLMSIMSAVSSDTLCPERLSRSLSVEEAVVDGQVISKTTLEALRYYKQNHHGNFCQSQIEEQARDSGIFITTDSVMRMLVKSLHIGKDPDKNCTTYQPIFFSCPHRETCLYKVFSRTMWLLSKTRKEMQASILEDHQKVMKVLEKQVKMVLQEKPMNFKALTNAMSKTTYDVVAEQWRIEKEEQMQDVLTNNPCVKEVRKSYEEINKKVVFQQRMNILHAGQSFQKIVDNKKVQNALVWLKVYENNRQFLVVDWDNKSKVFNGAPRTYSISNITHIVEGKACPHMKNDKEEHLVFSLIIDNATYLNFTTTKKETVQYWTDGFYLLTGKPNRSSVYHSELKQLVEMDVVLHLLELQEVPLPKKPPPIPTSPYDPVNKPEVPPKSTRLLSRISRIS